MNKRTVETYHSIHILYKASNKTNIIISEFVFLANRRVSPNVDFLIVTLKLLIPILAYIALALQEHDVNRY